MTDQMAQPRELDRLVRRYAAQVVYEVVSPLDFVPTKLREGLHRSFASGGKRLRPALTMLVNGALRGRKEEALASAAAVELIHNASLILDDIIDGDERRRGRVSFHRRFGIDVAIVTSGLLLTKAIQMVAPDPRRAAVLCEAMRALGLGQSLELHEPVRDLTGYERVVDLKTSALFRAAAELGAIAAGASRPRRLSMARYGGHLGTAFQVRDDILGACGEERILGKPVGSDLLHGRPSIVSLIYARQAAISLPQLARLAGRNRSFTKEPAFQRAIREAQAIAEHHAAEARGCLRRLRRSDEADALLALTHFATSRGR